MDIQLQNHDVVTREKVREERPNHKKGLRELWFEDIFLHGLKLDLRERDFLAQQSLAPTHQPCELRQFGLIALTGRFQYGGIQLVCRSHALTWMQ